MATLVDLTDAQIDAQLEHWLSNFSRLDATIDWLRDQAFLDDLHNMAVLMNVTSNSTSQKWSPNVELFVRHDSFQFLMSLLKVLIDHTRHTYANEWPNTASSSSSTSLLSSRHGLSPCCPTILRVSQSRSRSIWWMLCRL